MPTLVITNANSSNITVPVREQLVIGIPPNATQSYDLTDVDMEMVIRLLLPLSGITYVIQQIAVPGGGGTALGGYDTVQDEGVALVKRAKINFTGGGVTATDNPGAERTDVTITTGGGSAYATIQDEGASVTQRAVLNFIGSGVTAVDNPGATRTDITISSGGSAYATVQDEGTPLTQRTSINFIGAGVTAVDNAGASRTDVTISGGGGGTPGGSDTQVQFNDAGSFGGDAGLTYNKTTDRLTSGSLTVGDTGLTVGASVPFSDSAGVLTLQNVDALDSTSRLTIQSALVALPNVTSIQSQTVTLAGGVNVPATGLTVSSGAGTLNQSVANGASPTFGTVTATTLTGTLSTVSQPNVTTMAGLVSVQGQTVTLSGALTVSSGAGTLNQSVASGASPTFGTVTATTLAGTLSTVSQPNVTTMLGLTSIQGQTVTLSGALTVSSGAGTLNQSVANGASPAFGTVTATNLGGTLTTASQPNVTTMVGLTSIQGQTVTLSGALNVSSGAGTLNQSVSTTGTPSFASVTIPNSSSSTTPLLSITQSSTGDAAVKFVTTAAKAYALGLDQSAGSSFVLSTDAAGAPVLGTNNLLTVTSSGATALTGLTASTENVFTVSGNSLTTGSGVLVQSSSADVSARTLARIINTNAAASGATVMSLENSSSGNVLSLASNGATLAFTAESIVQSAGTSLNINADSVAFSRSLAADTHAVIVANTANDAAARAAIIIQTNSDSAGDPIMGWAIAGADTFATGIDNSVAGNPLVTVWDAAEDPNLGTNNIEVLTQNGDRAILRSLTVGSVTPGTQGLSVTSATTGGTAVSVVADSLSTGGGGLSVTSNASNNNGRTLVSFANQNTGATGTTVLNLNQAATGVAAMTINSTTATTTPLLKVKHTSTGDSAIQVSLGDTSTAYAFGIDNSVSGDPFVIAYAASGDATLGTNNVLSLTSASALTVSSVLLGNTGLTIGASVPFSDSAGVLTLQNVDALDSTTAATIAAAIGGGSGGVFTKNTSSTTDYNVQIIQNGSGDATILYAANANAHWITGLNNPNNGFYWAYNGSPGGELTNVTQMFLTSTGDLSTVGAVTAGNGVITDTYTTNAAGTISFANETTTGTVNIANGLTTGTLTIGSSAGSSTISLGDGAGSGRVFIGSPSRDTEVVRDLYIDNGNVFSSASQASNLFTTVQDANVSIATGLTTGALAIGTASSTSTLSLGGGAGSGTVTLGSSTRAVAIAGTTLTGPATSVLQLFNNNTTGGIIFANGLTSGDLTIGTNSGSGVIYFGDGTGTGTINIGSASRGLLSVGALATGANLTVQGGNIVTAPGTASKLFGTTTTGTVDIAVGLTTGAISIGTASSTSALFLGGGTGSGTVNIGSTTRATVIGGNATITGTTTDGSTNVLVLKDSASATVGTVDSDGNTTFLGGLKVGSVTEETTQGDISATGRLNLATFSGATGNIRGTTDLVLNSISGSGVYLNLADTNKFALTSTGVEIINNLAVDGGNIVTGSATPSALFGTTTTASVDLASGLTTGALTVGTATSTSTALFGGGSGSGVVTVGSSTRRVSMPSSVGIDATPIANTELKITHNGSGTGVDANIFLNGFGSGAGYAMVMTPTGAGDYVSLRFNNSSGTEIGTIASTASQTLTTYNTSSDARLKTDTGREPAGLSQLQKVKIHNFDWKHADVNGEGVFAQELYEVLPAAVTPGTDELDEQGRLCRPWQVDYSKLVPLLVRSVQQVAQAVLRHDEYESRIMELEMQLGAMHARLEALETHKI